MNSKHHLLGYAMVAGAILTTGVISWVRAGDVNPPAGAVQGTMHTLDEIYAKVQTLESQLLIQCGSEGRESIFSPAISQGSTFTVSGTGRAILWSATAHTGFIEIQDQNGAGTVVGRVFAKSDWQDGTIRYNSSNQLFFGVEVDLPLAVRALTGSGQSASFQLVLTRL